MSKVVVSDTSTLILFEKIDELNLLKKVYGELHTTVEIAEEYGSDYRIGLGFILFQIGSIRVF